MPRQRRSPQRARLGQRLGEIVREARVRGRETATGLGRMAGLSRQMIRAIETGVANPTLDSLVAVFDALGLEAEVSVRGSVILASPRVADAAHAIISAHVQRRLEALGWLVAREVRIEDGRYLGWIDLLAFDPATGTLLVIELKTQIDDIGALERSMDWHLRGARAAARRLGWRPTRAHGWLLALATDEVDAAITDHRATFDRAFPVRAAEMGAGLLDPRALPSGRGVALLDPSSHRRGWLIRTRTDGRRSRLRYRGYADFMATRSGGVVRRAGATGGGASRTTTHGGRSKRS